MRSLIAELGDALLRGAAAHARSGRSTSRTPIRSASCRSSRRCAFLPRVEIDADAAWRAGHGQTIQSRPRPRAEHVLLADADGPVAIAEPREDGLLKPVVGFRG